MSGDSWDRYNYVYSVTFPVYIDDDGRSYFSFSLLREDGSADDVCYRDMAFPGSREIMLTVVRAYADKKKLAVRFSKTGPKRVEAVEL